MYRFIDVSIYTLSNKRLRSEERSSEGNMYL